MYTGEVDPILPQHPRRKPRPFAADPFSRSRLKNTRERLSVLYGERHRLDVGGRIGGGTRAAIELPLSRSREAA